MCGIICFFGQTHGVTHVLEALRLLEYRAPDSSGLALIGEDGRYSIQRSVGTPRRLIEKMAGDPLYPVEQPNLDAIDLLRKQGLGEVYPTLRDCSIAAGYTLEDLYAPGGLCIGVGDRGSPDVGPSGTHGDGFSSRMAEILDQAGASASPDFDRDPVRHAFRLVGAHVTSRAGLDDEIARTLNAALKKRVPAGSYASWEQAWAEEVRLKVPGMAFAVAVRHFQETFPGLAAHLADEDWERVGGLTAAAMTQVVLGHGRWAMVGEVTEANAHPFVDRSGTRSVCENGSHNASRLLTLRRQQENWWRGRGLPESEAVHRSENTTEVLVYEWERTVHRIQEDKIDAEERGFIDQLVEWGVADVEDQALRLTLRRVRPGTAHACAFHSRLHPGVLYVSSHHKPIAIITRKHTTGQEIMVASDINAALMLWPGDQVDAAAERIEDLQKAISSGKARKEEAQQEIQSILEQFNAEVIFLDQDLYGGEELLARIESWVGDGEIHPAVHITRYDGAPVAVKPRRMQLNPAVVGKQGYPTYTEFHIAEIPDVLDNLVLEYVRDGEIDLASTWLDENIYSPGLNLDALTERFGPHLERLERLMLVGEGSSWRDAQAAAPLFRELLPEVLTVIYRPGEVLNLGKVADPVTTLVVEISWSGTTDSVLKADSWFAGAEVLRLGITGRPQSDLGRRTASSAGTLDVHSGVEVSVATVKGFEAILMTLNLAALQISRLHRHGASLAELASLQNELTLSVPRHVRAVVEDELRRERIHEVGRRCRDFNKVAVVGDSPIIIEGELKIEELAQIVACPFDFHMPSLRSLIERSAMVAEDRHRTLFIINATSPKAQRETRPVLNYLMTLGAYCIVHTTPGEYSAAWQNSPTVEIFHSPQVTDRLQPLIDALFFFDFAVAMAYGRGLTPKEIDRPRNLAKSVTTTGAEKRADVEARREFANITLTEFGQKSPELATSAAMKPSVSMRQALAVLTEPLPDRLSLAADRSLVIVTDSEAIENAANMARGAWVELFGVDISVFRQFITEPGRLHDGTNRLRLVRAGAILSVLNAETIAFPEDMSPLQLELLGTVYLTGLAVRLARQRGENMEAWEAGIARLPRIVSEVRNGGEFAKRVRRILRPFVQKGYDKVQVIGGGQDFTAGASIARSLRERGFMAEALHTDSAWHGPLATVGGPDAEHDTLIVILATDPLFQPAAMVDTQVYRTRRAPVILVVPEGSQNLDAVRGVNASAVLTVPLLPRAFVPVANAALGAVLAREMDILWSERQEDIFPLEE